MKKLVLAAVLTTFLAAPAFAAYKTYQVTGPILETAPGKVVVQKGKDKWEINLGSTALPADAKVGSKVTIEYTMTAASITVKGESKKAK